MKYIPYSVLSNNMLSMITDYSLLKMCEEDILELQIDWIHSAVSNPRIRKMYSSFSLDDEMIELGFELKNSVDDEYDYNFTVHVLSLGMVIAWLEQKVMSIVNISQMFSGKEENFYSQATHLSEIKGLLSDKKSELSRYIRDHGTYNNSYIGGVT